ncbi:MAG: GTP cyclohydrolase II [Deltaproteobacteria bacterium]|nr:GTP cyclohydrolase II [Deltaproteobacteria bacterium]
MVRHVASAWLPTRFGDFRILGFVDEEGQEYVVLTRGDVAGAEDVPVRLHSECFTGDVLGSLRCDCREQLEASLRFIGHSERGVVLYLPHEGRGIGLLNKIRAYALQELGLDTVEANLALGFESDLRTWGAAAAILRILQVRSIRLLTNNPDKIEAMDQLGIPVTGRIPLRMKPTRFNRRYLDTKRDKCGHLL